jgi:outer membrane lipoprotein-sorting protein
MLFADVMHALNRSPRGHVVSTVLRVFVMFIALSTSLTVGVARVEAQDSPGSSAPTIDSILTRMARIQGLHCSYREEKRIALLSSPITSEGTIDYARPGRMIRRVTRPSAQVVFIDGGELRMSEGGHTQRIDLAAQPVVRSFVDSFLQLLQGDRRALERTYTLTLETGADAAWTLILRPRAAPLTQFVREIRFMGHGQEMTQMVMLEVSGDSTTTTFTQVNPNQRLSASDAARVFSLTP